MDNSCQFQVPDMLYGFTILGRCFAIFRKSTRSIHKVLSDAQCDPSIVIPDIAFLGPQRDNGTALAQ